MSSKLKLHCLVLSVNRPASVEDIFRVEIAQTEIVLGLKEAMNQKIQSLRHLDAHSLKLWKVSIPTDNHFGEAMRKLDLDDTGHLAQMDRLSSLFSDVVDNHLHVVVRPPTDTRKKRAPSEPLEDIFDRLKRARLVTATPSDTGNPRTYEKLQEDLTERILDDWPLPDVGIPPIPLLYKGFGHFSDIMNGRNDVPGLIDVDIQELQKAVDDFAEDTNGYAYCDSEDSRGSRDDAVEYNLNRIFSARSGIKIPPLVFSTGVGMNSHTTTMHGAGVMVVQVKDRTGIDEIPQVEMVSNVARLNATGSSGIESRHQLYLRWRVPCLGLTIVGTDVTFYAIVAIDHRFRLVSLTPTFSCLNSASDGRDRTSLYSAFTAASILQAHIIQDTEALLNNLSVEPIPASERCVPAVSQLRKYPPSHGGYLTFKISDYPPNGPCQDLLYAANISGDDEQLILIKFSRRYSIELHDFCAKAGHAPPILAFERLPGGWYGVAMEYVESSIPINDSEILPAQRVCWTEELQDLVDSFHANGFVHGDLRDVNVICNENAVMLFGFDWSGRDGEVSYPTGHLHSELKEGRTCKDLKITQEDDRRVLKRTLAKLGGI